MTKTMLSFRVDKRVKEELEAHRQRLQQQAPASVTVSMRAALEDLIMRMLEKEGRE